MTNEEPLEEKVRRLEEEVGELKSRIHQLENKVYLGTEIPFEEVKQRREEEHPIASQPEKHIPFAPPPRQSVKQERVDWEKVLFQVWMPRLFIFVFIIGVLWAFKAASNYGFINEPVKIAFGIIASGLLLYVGQKQMKQGRGKMGLVLLGGSVPLLMLTTFAMHSLYNMVGPVPAFVLNVTWIALGLVLTRSYRSEVLGIISMVGGVLVPFLIESQTPNPYVFLGYETLLYLLFLSLAVRFQYMLIYYGSALLLNAALFIFCMFAGDGIKDDLVAIPVIIQYIVLLFYFIRENAYVNTHANTLLASLFVTYTWVEGTFTDNYVTLFLFGFIVLYAILAITKRGKPSKAMMFDIHFIILTAFFIVHAVDERFITSLLLIQGLAAYYSSLKYPSLLKKVISLLIYTLAGLTVLVEGAVYKIISFETVDWLALLMTFVVGANIMYKHETIRKKHFLTISSGVFAILALLFTTQFTLACVEHLNDQTQRLILTFVWMAMAVISMAAGVLKEVKQAKYIGVSLLILTLLKLVLLDLPFIPLFIRAILFIVLGFVGLMVSRVFYKKK
jgi:uncharacterized membrane protein